MFQRGPWLWDINISVTEWHWMSAVLFSLRFWQVLFGCMSPVQKVWHHFLPPSIDSRWCLLCGSLLCRGFFEEIVGLLPKAHCRFQGAPGFWTPVAVPSIWVKPADKVPLPRRWGLVIAWVRRPGWALDYNLWPGAFPSPPLPPIFPPPHFLNVKQLFWFPLFAIPC